MIVTISQGANLALAFLIELCMLAAFAFWGIHTGDGLGGKIALGLGAPLLAAIGWGIFLAPRAVSLSQPVHVLLAGAVFLSASLALAASGRPALAWILFLAYVLNQALVFAWGQSA
jgi:hypothetical protein